MRLLGDFVKNFIPVPTESIAYVPSLTTGVDKISLLAISDVSPFRVIRGKSAGVGNI